MKIAIVAGGTGGHIYPGIAIADEIKRRDPGSEILFFGSHEGMEQELVNQAGYDIQLINSRPLHRHFSLKNLTAPIMTTLGFFQAVFALARFSPKALIATGGYASLPLVLAANFAGIPIYLHEQNVLPGAVNRFCKNFAKKIFLSFHASKQYLPGEVVGNPVRTKIINADKTASRKALNLSSNKKVILVMGGSQGAKRINEAVVASLDNLPQDYEILHIVGNRDFSWVNAAIEGKTLSNYHAMPYLHHNIADAIAAADLVVSRAGATATAEFLVRGLPMILVPYPYAADNHQMKNARVLEGQHAAIVIEDKDFTFDKFLSIISDPKLNYASMVLAAKRLAMPDAAKRIIDYVFS